MSKSLRALVTVFTLLLMWQLVVWVTGVQHFILPTPVAVFQELVTKPQYFLSHSLVTAMEIVLGFCIGCMLGLCSAWILYATPWAKRWVLPVLVVSQAIPVFALAPLLTLWLGFGLPSKIVMTVLIIYFPVVIASFDGLSNTPKVWLTLASTMSASPTAVFRHIRLPNAMPAIGSGIRVAASVAPIGAVVGEWVGSQAGLGFVMLNANGRMQTDELFAALLCLCFLTALFFFTIDALIKRLFHRFTHQ